MIRLESLPLYDATPKQVYTGGSKGAELDYKGGKSTIANALIPHPGISSQSVSGEMRRKKCGLEQAINNILTRRKAGHTGNTGSKNKASKKSSLYTI